MKVGLNEKGQIEVETNNEETAEERLEDFAEAAAGIVESVDRVVESETVDSPLSNGNSITTEATIEAHDESLNVDVLDHSTVQVRVWICDFDFFNNKFQVEIIYNVVENFSFSARRSNGPIFAAYQRIQRQ